MSRQHLSAVLTPDGKPSVEKNTIIRKVASEDPRKNEIKLTKTFVNNTKKVSAELMNLESILEQDFTLEEKSELIRLLKKLAENLIEEERKKDV